MVPGGPWSLIDIHLMCSDLCSSPTQRGDCLPHRKVFNYHTKKCSSAIQKGVRLPYRKVFVCHRERCLSPTQKLGKFFSKFLLKQLN